MMDAIARYRKVVSTLAKLQQDQELRGYINEILPHLNNSVRIMAGHLDALIQNRTVVSSKQARDTIFKTAMLLLDNLMRVRLTPKVKQYAQLWYELANNWNMQVGFDDNLRVVLNAIATLLEVSTTLSELLDSIRVIAGRLKLIMETESSGAKLSGMFLNTIHEMIEDEKKCEVVKGKKG